MEEGDAGQRCVYEESAPTDRIWSRNCIRYGNAPNENGERLESMITARATPKGLMERSGWRPSLLPASLRRQANGTMIARGQEIINQHAPTIQARSGSKARLFGSVETVLPVGADAGLRQPDLPYALRWGSRLAPPLHRPRSAEQANARQPERATNQQSGNATFLSGVYYGGF
jgi:hypothetical protein